ncbi:MAG: hypothetical protein H8E36_02100 [Rhodospirillaceae bacterium]|nr:hypothetical protein [Rhodospirillaceae bacterium]MBL6941520.1 hypothetical protein [Rhodospirillales bacterium]
MNRKVTYFRGGIVADFTIPEDRFDEFSVGIDLKGDGVQIDFTATADTQLAPEN